MSPRRAPALLAGATCLAWLTLTTGYGAAAAAPGLDLGGVPLPNEPSTDGAHPRELAPGLWRVTLGPTYSQFFSYERRINGSRVHVGVLGAPQGTSSDGIRVVAGVATKGSSDPTSCGDEGDSTESSVPQAVIGARLVVGDEDGSTGDTCRAAGTIQIEVSRGYASATTDLPYVIKVVEEAPSSGAGDEEADDTPAYDRPDQPEDTEPLDGAASFDEAPELDARDRPAAIRTTLREGSERLWRLPLDWGDQPVVRVDVAAAPDGNEFAYSGPGLSLHLIDPLRGRLGYADSGAEDSTTGTYLAAADDREPSVLVAAGEPVRPVDGRLPGDYWVSLAASPLPESADRKAVEIPVTLTVAVDHHAGAAPTYDGVAVAQDKKTSLDGYSPERPFLVGEDTFAAVASGSPLDDGWLTTRRWAGFGLAAASVACLGAGVVRLRARR
ncbi:hypothetical protein [Nocardioides nitrophenolicus]|uniref:hypothetical protein n=1 Tax=Nocardioides nitrophenolicus TaxID=60489 RepID=UPI00195AC4C7|nr:hypothetical protein [Nocardioides nitrophenolicus]MBM7517802.1 hypothetical protein [Nocardioides nitrophenolicus]